MIRNKSRGIATKFVVVRGRIKSPPLIGKDSLEELGVVQIQQDASFAQTKDPRIPDETSSIKAVERGATRGKIEAITNKYNHI